MVSPLYRALKRAPRRAAMLDPRLKPWATVLTPALPAVRANSNYATLSAHCRTATIVRVVIACSATRSVPSSGANSGGEAAVKTVAPGFNRGFPDAPPSREPALAGDRTVLA